MTRGAGHVSVFVADLRARDLHQTIVDTSAADLTLIDAVLIAHGTLPDQEMCDHDVDATLDAVTTNALSVISIMHRYASVMEAQGGGELCVISSVAGERGRASNYAYGAAKAAVTQFASGLRGRLTRRGVQVTTILPGFVDTPMTARVAKKGLLFSSASRVAAIIVRAMEQGADVVYAPGYWRWIMRVVKLIPERFFKVLKF
jgi:short-subunit dehydrogenase